MLIHSVLQRLCGACLWTPWSINPAACSMACRLTMPCSGANLWLKWLESRSSQPALTQSDIPCQSASLCWEGISISPAAHHLPPCWRYTGGNACCGHLMLAPDAGTIKALCPDLPISMPKPTLMVLIFGSPARGVGAYLRLTCLITKSHEASAYATLNQTFPESQCLREAPS